MIKNRLGALRKLMKAEGMQGYYIPSSDCHCSEYLGEHFKTRAYMSGFTGSAGTLIVLEEDAGLWTDARYFLQAEQQLEGSGIELFRMGEQGVPKPHEYLLERLPEGAVLGTDGRTLPAQTGRELKEALARRGISLATGKDLVGMVWQERPAPSPAPAWALAPEYCGQSAAEKLAALRGEMQALGCNVHVIATLDDVAWLFNLRGEDIQNTPVPLAFAVIGQDFAHLCMAQGKLTPGVSAQLKEAGASCIPYEGVYRGGLYRGKTVLLDPGGVSLYLLELVEAEAGAVVQKPNPTQLKKAVKNPVELANLKKAHVLDGLAVLRTMKYLKTSLGQRRITELDIARYANERRAELGAISPSFGTIAAYGEHAAIMHYNPTPATNTEIREAGFLLLDSGGQYLLGTTDITRTMACGPLTGGQKLHFALVLKAMLSLSAAVFPEGCSGMQLDVLARQPLWQLGEDYKHGTGHGIGYLLGVHEGPNSIRWRQLAGREPVPLLEGMVTSNEPGYYADGEYGIRTENAIVCCKGPLTPYGQFMRFETLTLCPIDLDAVDPALLDKADIQRLNAYHEMVFAGLSPHLEGEELAFLRQYTRAI